MDRRQAARNCQKGGVFAVLSDMERLQLGTGFSGMELVTAFAKSYVAKVKRALPFGLLGVHGRITMRSYSHMQTWF